MLILMLLLIVAVVLNAFALRSLGQRTEALEQTVSAEISAIIARLEEALAKAVRSD